MRLLLLRCAFIGRRLPRAVRQAAAEWRILHSSSHAEILGFAVRLYRIGASGGDAVNRLAEALHLIREHDPLRFARMQRDLAYIVVKPTAGAYYWVLSNACALELSEVLRRSPSSVALMIVHEATHARLARAGVYPSPRVMRRIEQRCLAEERSFTLRLQQAGFSGTERVLAWLDSCLEAT